jgi:DDE superfamily endonuclease
MSNNGWNNDFLCTEWFQESFIPQATEHNTSGAPILLILDGHGSHTTDEMRKLAKQHNIKLFCLPPHTTHHTQPLDVGVFGPLQQQWQECDDLLEDTGKEICKVDFVKEYMAA